MIKQLKFEDLREGQIICLMTSEVIRSLSGSGEIHRAVKLRGTFLVSRRSDKSVTLKSARSRSGRPAMKSEFGWIFDSKAPNPSWPTSWKKGYDVWVKPAKHGSYDETFRIRFDKNVGRMAKLK